MGLFGSAAKLGGVQTSKKIENARYDAINGIAQDNILKFVKTTTGCESLYNLISVYEGLPNTYFEVPGNKKEAIIVYEQASKLLTDQELRSKVADSVVYFLMSGTVMGVATYGLIAIPEGIITVSFLSGKFIPREDIEDIFIDNSRKLQIRTKDGNSTEILASNYKEVKAQAERYVDMLKKLYCSPDGSLPDIEKIKQDVKSKGIEAVTGAARNYIYSPVIDKSKTFSARIKKIVYGIMIVFVIIAILSLITGQGDTDTTDNSSSDAGIVEQSDTADTAGTAGTEEQATAQSGATTPYDIYEYLSDNELISYTLTDNAANFLREHPQLFPAATEEECDSYTNWDIEYKHISKSPLSCGGELMFIMGDINEIYEYSPENTGLDSPLTVIRISDYDGNIISIFYIDTIDLYEGDSINGYVLPLDLSSYENALSGQTTCLVCAGAYLNGRQY